MYWLATIAFVFLGVRLVIALINMLGNSILRTSRQETEALVSVLIPARNEAQNIEGLLEGLLQQTHVNFEILVYDDGSEDQTLAIVSQVSARDSRVQGIAGTSLPEGWLGKNHACHRLAQKAKGKFLLFLDADVRVSIGLVNDLLGHMFHHQLKLLSIFPVQRMYSPGEKLTVPLMNHILLSFLPLVSTRLSKRPSLAAANGQCMMFDAETYRSHCFHASVREEAVEDIRIMKEMKKLGYKTEVLLSNGQVTCRMYTGYQAALEGFARNFHHFFGKQDVVMLAYGAWTTLAPIIAYLGYGIKGLLMYIFGILILRLTTAQASRQAFLTSAILSPLQHFVMLHIMLFGIIQRRKGNLSWKGRRIS